MAARTTAKEFFRIATELPAGKKISKTFETKNEAKSFRVCLYKIKNTLEAFDIAVSIQDTTVILTKEGPNLSYTQINEDGSKEEKSILVNLKAAEEASIKKESLREKERENTFNSPMTITEKIDWFNEEVFKIEATNEENMIKRQELRRVRLDIFKNQEKGIFFTKNEEDRLSFARLRTAEEALNETY